MSYGGWADNPELARRLNGKRVIASVSGGKDSAAMSLYLRELGIEHDRVFMDTGWEHEATYEYVRGPLTAKLGPIREIRPPKGMVELIRSKSMFPRGNIRFCTEELKVFPFRAHVAALADAGHEVVNAVGIRAEESPARKLFTEWEWSATLDCDVWRPILRWSFEDVVAIHGRHGLLPNPLYLKGASRVGCWPCIYARKAEIAFVAKTDPARIDEIRALETELTAGREKRGTPGRATFFAREIAGEAKRATPIDEVVTWAKTERGGVIPMFDPPADEGCMRWGLCDTGGPK